MDDQIVNNATLVSVEQAEIQSDKRSLSVVQRNEQTANDDDCDCLECVISPTTDVLILFGMDFSHSHRGRNKPSQNVLRGCAIFFVCLHFTAFVRSFFGAMLYPEFMMSHLNTTSTFSVFGVQLITAYCGWSFFILLSICVFAFADNKTSVRLFTRLSDETGAPENDETLKLKLLDLQNKLTCFVLPFSFVLSGLIGGMWMTSLRPTFQMFSAKADTDFMSVVYLFSLASLVQEVTHSIGLIFFTIQLFLLMLLAVRQESAELCEELYKFSKSLGRNKSLDFKSVQHDCHNLSRMAYAVDELFSVVFSLASVAFLVIFTYMLRAVIFASATDEMFIFITLMFLFMLVTLWLIMAMLSTAVQNPYKQLCRISCVNTLQIEDMERVLYLMNRVGGPPVGITLMRISVVTKPTVLKVFSLVVSIFVFLLQWKQISFQDKINNSTQRTI